MREPNERLRTLLFCLVPIAVVFVLSGGPGPSLRFALWVAFFVLPASVLMSRLPGVRTLPDDVRVVVGFALLTICLVPWYFARREIGLPMLVDTLAAGVLSTLAFRRPGCVARIWGEVRRMGIWLSVVIPVIFISVWSGYAVGDGESVRFYGLLGSDFGSLVSVVSTVRASPWLPQMHVAGAGPLQYHWLYFVQPAILADFLGGSIPNANALVLSNLITAVALFIGLSAAVRSMGDGAFASRAAAIAMLAPFSIYLYQAASARLELGWLEMPERNHLLLSPVNSMVTFGNNSCGLLFVLLSVVLLRLWNIDGRPAHLMLSALLIAVLPGLSVTLTFPAAATIVTGALTGRIRRGWVVLLVHAVVGGAGLVALHLVGLLGAGGPFARILFDQGQFLRVVCFGMAPILIVALAGGRRALTLFDALALSALLTPTILVLEGSPTGHIDLAMKMGTLIPLALAPGAAVSLLKSRNGARRWLLSAAVVVGALHTLVYVGQFPVYRIEKPQEPSVGIPVDYFDALRWVRANTPVQSIVVDTESTRLAEPLFLRDHRARGFTTMIGERRVWLPTPFIEENGANATFREREQIWRHVATGASTKQEEATLFEEVDFVITSEPLSQSANWREIHRVGRFAIFAHTLDLKRRSIDGSGPF